MDSVAGQRRTDRRSTQQAARARSPSGASGLLFHSVLFEWGMASAPKPYVVLLRGINVGGRAKLSMAALRDICAAVGCTSVETYVQSGNVVLESALSAAKLPDALEDAIDQQMGFRPRVVVRRHADFVRVLENNPYPDTEDRYLHVGFLSDKPAKSALATIDGLDLEPEGCTVAGKEIYLNYVEGAGRSKKLGKVPFEKRLGVAMTARNMRTVAKLAELSA
jgi:uncharacterized protein (DUF1697 family)